MAKFKFKEFLIAKFIRLVGFPADVSDFLNSLLSIGYASGEPFPKALIKINTINMIRGIFTRFVVTTNLDWIWPFWLERQFRAKYKDFSSRGFDPISVNTTNRNWTGVGTLDTEYESTVDPRGLITSIADGWSLDNWFEIDGKLYSPATLPEVKQTLHKNLPMVNTQYELAKKILVNSLVFATKIKSQEILLQRVTLKNISSAVLSELYFAFAVRPYNTEGLCLIKDLKFSEAGEIFVNKKLGAVLLSQPGGVLTSNLSRGDCRHYFNEGKGESLHTEGHSRVGMATGIAVYKLDLKPDEEIALEIRLPVNPNLVKKLTEGERTKKLTQEIKKGKFTDLLDSEVSAWQKKLTEGLQIKVPDPKIQEAFSANKAFMLLFYDGDYITPGPSTYHHFWFRDATYLLNALDKLGYHKETERILNTYRYRQVATGFFYSQSGEWDSNGQAIWSLVEHYRLVRDHKFLQKNSDIIFRGAKWIDYKRRSNLYLEKGYRGLIPPGLSAEHFGLNDYYYWDDFWSLAGLRDAAYTAEVLGKKEQQKQYQKYLDNLEKAMNDSLETVEVRLGKPIMPISPSRRMDSAAIGCLGSYYPCRIYQANNLHLVNTIKYLQEECFIGNGFFHDVNHAGFGTYLTMHIAQCYLGQRSKKALDILNWILSVASQTWTWPEAIHPRTMGGCIGDGHHGWAAADFILLIRNLLFLEEHGGLVLTPVLPEEWLTAGAVIEVQKAPTYFGTLNYKITVLDKKTLVLSFNPKFEQHPKFIEWSLPARPQKVLIDKKESDVTDSKVVFSEKTKEVKVTLA